MKASRLLHLLLLLQTRQRITTTELAARLEVSRRTVLRDVEALSAAGVPVYAERGRSGGIVLLPGARLNASHLEPPELEALSLAGLDSTQRERMGLSAMWESAARKIAARQAATSTGTSPLRLADLVLVDSTPWFADSEAAVDVADLASALQDRRRLRIRYRRSAESEASTRVVDPYGIVAKSGRWYLVADHRGDGRLFSLDRLAAFEQLDAPVSLRPGETLRTTWAALKDRTEGRGHVSVTFRLPEHGLDLARRILGTRIHDVSDPENGTCIVVVGYPDIESVRQLLQFGDHIEVLAPDAARTRISQLAKVLAETHSPPSS
ncbi:WYL domain-containing protein [Rhodococcus sp. BP-149]|jgi:predicted DNA-binding transcriptional regulator YafY|uniref:helix-turn-helix transcriptional regulator n=1 Tax=unclassified Rhodococcus (in: high G+C Gram-positive bacteria) TaxID=192944 RepID=UPI0006F5CB4C|nr:MULTISPECIES: WYL domain-containing protein [unclassified Rhodococcus (in: high G+C Gram-positive bacteria)]KQU39341.1 transcriptional regulator [Rhodococcus sp. Leaf225]KQU43777.1 transcriptional regulator [Rhodococcus sp. Leaf258]MBY6684463.1 WYL domain-containing protein [Rhodococcus sp. BP-288]MBY6692876.1 WYL domain-containing protein [Rhodococcus sp. BP-188]MBY6697073.1 WYL domain-containing protein [Rhodococcus sp. BP-285]